MGGINYTVKGTSMPKTVRLISNISSYLFEEQYGECKNLKPTTIKNLRAIINSLSRAVNKH